MPTLKIDYQLARGTGAKGEPIRQGTWEVDIDGIDVTLHAVTFEIAQITVEPAEIFHFNERAKIAGAVAPQNATLEVLDVIDPDIASQLYDWYTTVYDPSTGVVGYASEYKRSGTCFLYDTKGNLQQSWDMYGLWPTKMSQPSGALDYTANGEPVRINVEFACDRVMLQGGGAFGGINIPGGLFPTP
jgi:hypothetical protein